MYLNMARLFHILLHLKDTSYVEQFRIYWICNFARKIVFSFISLAY